MVVQDIMERNFHVSYHRIVTFHRSMGMPRVVWQAFYQLLKGDSPALREIRRNILFSSDGAPVPCASFAFLNQSGCIDLEGKSDVADYAETESVTVLLVHRVVPDGTFICIIFIFLDYCCA